MKQKKQKIKRYAKAERKLSPASISFRALMWIGQIVMLPFDVAASATFEPQRFYSGNIQFGGMTFREIFENPDDQYAAIANLKRSMYLHKNKKGLLELTPKAKKEILKYSLAQKIQNIGKEWDGKIRLIFFDIPESRRWERDFLRELLKAIGCKELQQSVWITLIDIEDEFRELVKLCKKDLRGDIRFVTVETISPDEDIKEYFRLKEKKLKK